MQASHEGHISITGVSKFFGRHKALDNVSLEIPPGSVTVILGPSGSGKSTLLRTINHLERVDEGFIQIDGDYIGYRRRGDKLYELKEKEILKQRVNVGYVFQNFNLFPHLTVLENLIEAPVAHKKLSKKEAVEQAYSLLDVVGLRDKADAWSRHLSGGQQQRIAIARALALRPSVLLADEATSGLDPQATASVLALLKRLRDEYQLAIVLITHEMDAVRTAADAVAEIRDGTIVQYGRIEDLLARPDSLLGQQLLPLTPAAATHSDLLLRLSYRWDVPVATDWISRLSQQWALQIDLLGGHVEVINGRLAGRLQAGVRFQGERLSPARLQGLLAQLGITAEILDSAPLLREAV